uniref:neurosecretory protein VGF n=1 Tax=Solea senegalensis TaxID=28829 RepID=UPI001CD85419|nr:neurosecretory protein VGF [Solea senegalensis]
MIGSQNASSVLTLLVLLTGASLLHVSSPKSIGVSEDDKNPDRDTVSGLKVSADEETRSLEREEAEEELFKDVDPKTLAAVLLEALNQSQGARGEEEMKAESGEVKKEEEYRQVRTMEGADRDRDGRQELELLMATQGREQEEEERRKAQEEEEKMTEKVTSRTTSQTVQVQQSVSPESGAEKGKGDASQQGPAKTEQGEEEEEQLNPEELKSLETMMKEFPRVDTATKRKVDSENQRESRGYSNNYIVPINKGGNIAMSKKKLKWQEETQKGLNVPSFRGGNFMDDFEDTNYENNAVQSQQPPAEQDVMEEDEPDVDDDEEEEKEEEMLSPEEEEARAKAEQEEMRRQAAEAQRAKMEEEKLADIASDMLLRYMVKQTNGNKKYSPSLSNAAEDKRSDEDPEVMEEDDIDPQTIDKLIEISSKLHLPADDVVDIISDVEKKKKKDVPPELSSRWQLPLTPISSSFSSKNGFAPPPISTSQNNFPDAKQPSPAVNLLKTWFHDKTAPKSPDRWSKPVNPLQNLWSRPQRPLSIKQDFWRKSPKSVWTGYPSYPYVYPFYYQRKPYPDYYPVYYSPSPRPKPRYYIPKPAITLNKFLGNSLDDGDSFPPKRRYHSWVQPRLKAPPSAGFQQKPYYSSYNLRLYPRTFQPLPVAKPRSPPRMPVISPPQKQRYYSAVAPAATRNEDYYTAGKLSDSSSSSSSSSSRDDLENYIQRILMNRPQILD